MVLGNLGRSNYNGVVGTDIVQLMTTTTNVGSNIHVTPESFPLPRGLFYIVIHDSGVSGGNGYMTFFGKGGISKLIGDRNTDYFINEHVKTNFNTSAASFSTGPDVLVVTNSSTSAEYTITLKSRTNIATIQQTVGTPEGDIIVNVSITSF